MNSILQNKFSDNDNCYSDSLLYDFILGKVDDELAAKIVSHLEQCTTCEDTIVAIEDKEDTFVESLPRKSVSTPAEPQLESVIESIKNRDFEFSSQDAGNIHDLQIGDYQIESTLGVGGMGTVFRATHGHLEKEVALKVLPHRKMQNSEAISRFRREMKIIGQLDHPAIVKATDAGQDQGTHYLAMEFVNGFDLSRLIKLVGVLDCKSSCEIIRQAAIGIDYVHSQGIIHRDIKPSNLMLTGEGKVKILDLGLAMLSSVQGMVDELTTVGQLMGTLDYMAPEQYGDCHNIDLRADLYALGATLYKLVTGVAPYEQEVNESPLQKLKRIATESAPPIQQKSAGLDSDLAAVIDQSISRDQEQRFTSAKAFAEALAPFASDESLKTIFDQAKSEEAQRQDLQRIAVSFPEDVASKSQRSNSEISRPSATPVTKAGSGQSNRPRTGWWLRTAVVALFLAGAFCLGIIIQIEMDKGRLVIESESDNVKITLLKDGKVYDKMELEQGTNSTRIRAGKYEVVIDEGSDKLILDQDQFKLTRGETIVAKITQSRQPAKKSTKGLSLPPEITVADTQANGIKVPVFKGMNLDQWLEKVAEDTFNPANYSTPRIDSSTLQAIKRLSTSDNQKKIDRAAEEWAEVVSTETSLDQIYKLVPLMDILANNERNTKLLLVSFVDALHENMVSLDMRIATAKSTRYPAKYIFSGWSDEKRKQIEQMIFDSRKDKLPYSEIVRISFLQLVQFDSSLQDFDASRENIFNLLKAFNESSSKNRLILAQMLDMLLYNPERLSAEIRAELISKYKTIARDSKDFKYLAIRSLIRLGEKTQTVLLDITDNLEHHPNLVELLVEFDNIDQPIQKIKTLLSDPNWGWTREFRNSPLSPEKSRLSSASSFGGMMGSSGGGGMSSMGGMSGSISSGSMSAAQMRALMGGGRRSSSNQSNNSVKTNQRLELVIHLAALEEKAMALVPILKEQQSLTHNSQYLERVWNSIFEITKRDPPRTYSAKELAEWKKILASASSQKDLAIAMIANAQLIGDMDFDNIFFGRPRTRSSSAGKGRVKVENKNDYRRYIQSLLPRIRNLDFENLDTSKSRYPTCYEDPRMAAFLICKDFTMDLIQAGNVPDYPFLILLNQETEQVDSYTQFVNDVLTKSKPGSNTQLRAVSRAGYKSINLLPDILVNAEVDLGVRFFVMESLLVAEIKDPRSVKGYVDLLYQNPQIALALFGRINEIKVAQKLGSRTGAKYSIDLPTLVAQLAFDFLVESKSLADSTKPTPFKQSKLNFDRRPFVFNSEAITSKSQIEGALDILLYSVDYGWIDGFVKQLETNKKTPSTVELVEKLKKIKREVDKVAQTKIDKFVQALIASREKITQPVDGPKGAQ